ncbi:LysM peptidoglycan-binding domain-containing protein [Pseudomonas sp. MH9.2]|uniref:lytic transglycosylase domain-containing protein n=1 Tax=unclassified Pseudomonas TaxID=196821 RepID=UPI002AC8F4FD|nr:MULTISPECIES: LysM peptidoglycan-binding domain-containing protein [unclassified Pseudomonas]MEB0006884.1 LysM peptidoglycan-binding domain-containing protein [Pseudomonas sp. RTB2]MEB0015680.1 LysM peptidoglycan-binding domain-containing protein [Pseudomonas sp. RTB3]MEB0025691.1 LysM peptidoglycan-binding domain-containing protein [Pseudomonas sp. MH9.2]MEB0146287.1 LysM peptidoglycan-binding domain-containing protein [Pseudomonas sp. CCC2.2]MEB0269954.1 LysM peptidoglycan-binding domain-
MSSSIRKVINSDALTRLVQAIAVALSATLAGCQTTSQIDSVSTHHAPNLAAGIKQKPIFLSDKPTPLVPQDVWERMRQGFQLQEGNGQNPRIDQQRLWFANNPSFLENAGERGSLYMHYIVERLEERNMPLELALLPVIESAYNPLAYSRSDAVGLWQFIPSTGRYFNLRQTSFYDGRRDITASTIAALDYLTRLHDMFNGDWLLALAAYNAGEGTVSRAIERNQKLGLPTDYWNLPLPQETQDYVPKFLALSQVVLAPEAYGVNLNPIANQPYFQVVELNQRMDLSKVAAMADIDEDELFQLNPAFKKRMTVDGPQHLLVPTAKAQLLTASLSNMKPQELAGWQQYRVRTGDTLASRDKPTRSRNYRVKKGDNLVAIAKANKVEVKDLQHWNQLSGRNLKVGQTLVMQDMISPKGKGKSKGKSSDKKSTQYTIRKGDSMYMVAKRFNVEMEHLQRLNPRSGHALKPGQTLTVYQAP